MGKAQACEFQTAAVFLQHDAPSRHAARFGYGGKGDGRGFRQKAQRRELHAVLQRMPEHRVEVDDIIRIIGKRSQKILIICPPHLNSTHGGVQIVISCREVRESMAHNLINQRAFLKRRHLAALPCDEARRDGIGAETERTVKHRVPLADSHRFHHMILLPAPQFPDTYMRHIGMEKQFAVGRFQAQAALLHHEHEERSVLHPQVLIRYMPALDEGDSQPLCSLLGEQAVRRAALVARRDNRQVLLFHPAPHVRLNIFANSSLLNFKMVGRPCGHV